MKEKYANIILLGRTGVGKSSFINYIIGKEICKTGNGKPVTQTYNEYIYENVDGLPLRIYDTKGIEVLELENQCSELKGYISKRCKDKDIFNWIHSIFYCINLKRGRLEPEEIRFIHELRNEISQTVHIIITNCPKEENGDLVSMKKYLVETLGEDIKICCVNSVETKNRKGVIPAFGRKQVLDELFIMLWSDISQHISLEYAKEFRNEVMNVISDSKYAMLRMADKFTGINIIKEFINDNGDFDEYLDNMSDELDNKIDKLEEELSLKYKEIVNPLIDFCNNYSSTTGYNIALLEYNDFMTDIDIDVDIDEIIEDSTINKKIEKLESVMDEIDGDTVFEKIGGMFRAVVGIADLLINFKKMFKEIIYDLFDGINKLIPSEKELSKQIYEVFMEQINI